MKTQKHPTAKELRATRRRQNAVESSIAFTKEHQGRLWFVSAEADLLEQKWIVSVTVVKDALIRDMPDWWNGVQCYARYQ